MKKTAIIRALMLTNDACMDDEAKQQVLRGLGFSSREILSAIDCILDAWHIAGGMTDATLDGAFARGLETAGRATDEQVDAVLMAMPRHGMFAGKSLCALARDANLAAAIVDPITGEKTWSPACELSQV